MAHMSCRRGGGAPHGAETRRLQQEGLNPMRRRCGFRTFQVSRPVYDWRAPKEKMRESRKMPA
eukprot:scaffold29538_cov120-Isochrysis_galbana.AAC.7